MMSEFFPSRPDLAPTIYAYTDSHPQFAGMLKIGETVVGAAKRVAEQYPTKRPGKPVWRIVMEESAIRSDGTQFSDRDIHRYLRGQNISNPTGEWFTCSVEQVKAAVIAVRNRDMDMGEEIRSLNFTMRPEQAEAVKITGSYFKQCHKEDPDRTPHFLWNAKMRFGKTFTAYQLGKKMGWKKVLVLTFKPAVQNAWESDLKEHVDFKGWQFISPDGLAYEDADKELPFVCFGSFQDYLGKNNSSGGIKTKNEWVHATNWDCVIIDEYHYGAWREKAKDLFESESKKEAEFGVGQGISDFDENILPITTDAYLYLSGTPFRAISSGEFIEEQIFNWT